MAVMMVMIKPAVMKIMTMVAVMHLFQKDSNQYNYVFFPVVSFRDSLGIMSMRSITLCHPGTL